MSNQNDTTACIVCGAVDEPEHSIVVGLLGETDEPVCNICRSEQLANETPLTQREADVHAVKELTGRPHASIAELLEVEKPTVDTLSARASKTIEESRRLASMVDS